MEGLPLAPLTLALALLLAACSPLASSPAEGAPVAPVQAAAQANFPTAATEVPAVQSTIVAADSAVVSSDPPNTCPLPDSPARTEIRSTRALLTLRARRILVRHRVALDRDPRRWRVVCIAAQSRGIHAESVLVARGTFLDR